MKLLFLLILSVLAFAHGVQKRDVSIDLSNMFRGLNSGFDHLQRQAEEGVMRFKPWAHTFEREMDSMKPAMRAAEEQLGSVLDNLGLTFGNDRIDRHGMNTQGKSQAA